MRIVLAALLAVTALGGHALALEKCAVPMADWQPREALKAKLEGEGWKVRSIKSEDGCYEAYAFDSRGAKVYASFDPKTFQSIDVKSGD